MKRAKISRETRDLARQAFVLAHDRKTSRVDWRAQAAEANARQTQATPDSAHADSAVTRRLAEFKRDARHDKKGRVRLRYRPRQSQRALIIGSDAVESVSGAITASDARRDAMTRNPADRSDNQRRDNREFSYRSLTVTKQDISAEAIARDTKRDLAAARREAARRRAAAAAKASRSG